MQEQQDEGQQAAEEEAPAVDARPTYYEVLSAEEDTTLRFVMLITNAISGVIERVQTLLVYWEKKYKHLWDQDKEAILWWACGFLTMQSLCLLACSALCCCCLTSHASRLERLCAVASLATCSCRVFCIARPA